MTGFEIVFRYLEEQQLAKEIKGTLDRHILTEPARRHKCEICKQIFECHLCDIMHEHPIHAQQINRTDPCNIVLVCEECCENPVFRFQPRKTEQVYFVDLLSGQTDCHSKKGQGKVWALKSHLSIPDRSPLPEGTRTK